MNGLTDEYDDFAEIAKYANERYERINRIESKIYYHEYEHLKFKPFYIENGEKKEWTAECEDLNESFNGDLTFKFPKLGLIVFKNSNYLLSSSWLSRHPFCVKLLDGRVEEIGFSYGINIYGFASFLELILDLNGITNYRVGRNFNSSNPKGVIFGIVYSTNKCMLFAKYDIKDIENEIISDYSDYFGDIIINTELAGETSVMFNEFNQGTFGSAYDEVMLSLLESFVDELPEYWGMRSLKRNIVKIFRETMKLEREITKYKLN